MDDDGRVRTGTLWSATTHAITAVIGSGVLALPWSVAQTGWAVGPLALVGCAWVTYYTATLLGDCYRTPDPVHGRRNHTYMDVVRACLSKRDVFVCGLAQYAILWGVMVGYTVTVAMSVMAVERSSCMHYKGHGGGDAANANCQPSSGMKYMVLFGLAEVFLSQFPSLEKVTLLSLLAAAMSFAYSSIALCLCVAKLVSGHLEGTRGSVLGVIGGGGGDGVSVPTRVWQGFQALGNIAFAYTYAMLLIEIQDTLKSPPAENKTMKRASLYGIGVTTAFYVSLGCVGYAAFGDGSPGNVLTGFDEPFWLVDAANIAVVIHLVGAYQVYSQPIFAKYESWLVANYPNSSFFTCAYTIPLPFRKPPAALKLSPCRLILRTAFVALTTLVAAVFPFFNAIVGLLGAIAFWPLTVYFPVTIYMAQAKVKIGQPKWLALQALSGFALLVSLAAAVGSVADIAQRLRNAKIFRVEI